MTPYQKHFWENLHKNKSEIAIIDKDKVIDYGRLEKYILYLNTAYTWIVTLLFGQVARLKVLYLCCSA